MRDEPERPPALSCARCGTLLRLGRGEWHLVEIRSVVDPSPPVFEEEDLAQDSERSIAELLGQLRGMSEQQLIDQVYKRRLFPLCAPCHAAWTADPFHDGGRWPES